MIGRHFGRTIHIPGTLAANIGVVINFPVDARLNRVSAVASNDSDATLAIGVGADTDNILAPAAIGDSGTPVVFDVDNWAATNALGQIEKGELLTLTLDFDGAAGDAADDVTIDLDFIEG